LKETKGIAKAIMKKIVKKKEPITLTHYRSSIPHDEKLDKSIYHDFKHKGKTECQEEKKDNLRKALLEEQGYICCYCMTRINCHQSKIEHFNPQSKCRKEQITYKNLFISCRGNTQHYKHCDTKKADHLLKHINLLKDIEATIRYKSNGEIDSSNIALIVALLPHSYYSA